REANAGVALGRLGKAFTGPAGAAGNAGIAAGAAVCGIRAEIAAGVPTQRLAGGAGRRRTGRRRTVGLREGTVEVAAGAATPGGGRRIGDASRTGPKTKGSVSDQLGGVRL